jgi:uroporphyrinogen decarboxylase
MHTSTTTILFIYKYMLLLDSIKNKNSKVPIWFMRQAGRYLPEYRKVRSNFKNFLDFCYNPEAVCEVTIQPITRFDFDAAIIFSDILVIPDAIGQKVSFIENKGPVLEEIKNWDDILRYDESRLEQNLNIIYDAIKLTRKNLDKNKPLIGFAAAPWTIACYMLEQKTSKDYAIAKKFIYQNNIKFEQLIDVLTKNIIFHLRNQILNGCDLIQIFDSWAGVLNKDDFIKYSVIPTQKIVNAIKNEFPEIKIIGFAKSIGNKIEDYSGNTGIDVVGIDYTIDINKLNHLQTTFQGNLDPISLFGEKNIIKNQVLNILDSFKDKKHIFNLGHGIMPETPIENVEYVVDLVKNYRR